MIQMRVYFSIKSIIGINIHSAYFITHFMLQLIQIAETSAKKHISPQNDKSPLVGKLFRAVYIRV